MREEIIKKVEEYLRTEMVKLASFPEEDQKSVDYRIEHSIRVAHIAAEIAEAEGFDVERLYVAGLLHDIAYSRGIESTEDWLEHGRNGAKIARTFLNELGCYTHDEIEEICYGIAIHVDEKSDFPGEKTPFTMTVNEADNIDRFDAFRISENLIDANYRDLSLAEQSAFLDKIIAKIRSYREEPVSTPTAERMFHDKLDFQLEFYGRLKSQVEHSV